MLFFSRHLFSFSYFSVSWLVVSFSIPLTHLHIKSVRHLNDDVVGSSFEQKSIMYYMASTLIKLMNILCSSEKRSRDSVFCSVFIVQIIILMSKFAKTMTGSDVALARAWAMILHHKKTDLNINDGNNETKINWLCKFVWIDLCQTHQYLVWYNNWNSSVLSDHLKLAHPNQQYNIIIYLVGNW